MIFVYLYQRQLKSEFNIKPKQLLAIELLGVHRISPRVIGVNQIRRVLVILQYGGEDSETNPKLIVTDKKRKRFYAIYTDRQFVYWTRKLTFFYEKYCISQFSMANLVEILWF